VPGLVGLGPALLLLALASAGDAPADALAVVEGTAITRGAVEERAKGDLARLRQMDYEARRQALDALIAEELLKKEAARRKLGVDALLEAEVAAKSAPVTPEQVDAQYNAVRARLGPRPEAEGRRLVEQNLVQQRRAERRAAFVKELRTKAGVTTSLAPPRFAVEVGGAPAKGPATAPVTIVEFADFECPFCGRVVPTLKQIAEKYGDKVRIAFRDYPLPNHTKAPKASEAAACAADQGQFWEMYEKLFAAGGRLDEIDLKRYAIDLGLDSAAFYECLDSGRKAAGIAASAEAGQDLGITGTPAFFINGRLLTGAVPLERFVEVIDEELARTSR
jgi:protein-disulfide isomerase